MDVGCGSMDLNPSKRLGHGPADYVKRKEIHRRAAERCAMVLKNRGGLEGMVALLELKGLIRGSRISLFFVFFSIRVLERFWRFLGHEMVTEIEQNCEKALKRGVRRAC